MAERTVDSYVTAVSSLAKYYHRPPDQITDQELQDYLLYLREEKHLARLEELYERLYLPEM
jgi:hypothetical protein